MIEQNKKYIMKPIKDNLKGEIDFYIKIQSNLSIAKFIQKFYGYVTLSLPSNILNANLNY